MTDTPSTLPWFAFNVKSYLSDTMRLTTESHGAYLLLMLDYYATGKPCPDDDFILAAVAKLTPEQWAKHRKVLEPFFDVRDNCWFHNRIEEEIRAASEKHAAASAQRAAASAARWGQGGTESRKQAKTPAKRGVNPARNPARIPAASPPAMRPVSGSDPQRQVHTTTPFGRSSSDDDATDAALAPDLVEDDLGTPIDPNFQLTQGQLELCMADGTPPAEIETQRKLFIAYNAKNGTWASNWIDIWSLWWQRHLERRAKEPKAPPRIEVNSAPFVPSEKDWDDACMRFARNNSIWSRHLGPDPDSPACKAPMAILVKHGLRRAKAS